MAAYGVNRLKVLVVHGQRKHDVTLVLPWDEVGDCLTVGHLVREIEKVTSVFVRHQKLFFNGRIMANHSDSLSHMGVKQGSKILMIGRSNQIDETHEEMTVRTVTKRTADVGKEFSNFIYELDGVNSKKQKLNSEAEDDDDDDDDPDYVPSSSDSSESCASHHSDAEKKTKA